MKKHGTVITLILIIVLSGCVLSEKERLEKSFIRTADSEELSEVFSFIENYDMLEFVDIDPNNSLVFQGFSTNLGFFVRNISQYLKEVEIHYSQSAFYKGKLEYIITGKQISSENVSSIKMIVSNLMRSISPFFNVIDDREFINYYPLNSTSNESTYLTSYNSFDEVNISLSDQMWLILVELTYSWYDRVGGGESFIFAELVLLDELTLSPLLLTSSSRHPIA